MYSWPCSSGWTGLWTLRGLSNEDVRCRVIAKSVILSLVTKVCIWWFQGHWGGAHSPPCVTEAIL